MGPVLAQMHSVDSVPHGPGLRRAARGGPERKGPGPALEQLSLDKLSLLGGQAESTFYLVT